MAGGCKELSDENSKSTSDCPPSKNNDDSDLKMKQKGKPCGKSMLDGKPEKAKSKAAGYGKDAFGRKICPPKEENAIECHESRKRFFEDRDKSSDKSDEGESEESKGESDCEDSCNKVEKESEKQIKSGKREQFCNNFGKQYVKFGRKTKSCSNSEDDEVLKMPEPQIMTIRPCLPKVEKSISCKKRKVSSCVSTENCPHLKKQKMTQFFLIDARNKLMTECMKQYMKTDPSKINKLCAQFNKKRMHTAAQDHLPCGYQCMPTLPQKSGGSYPSKLLQLSRRWAPTAGLYVAATALVTVWVTEWDAVVKHIPFYTPREEILTEQNTPPVTQDVPQNIPPQEEDGDD